MKMKITRTINFALNITNLDEVSVMSRFEKVMLNFDCIYPMYRTEYGAETTMDESEKWLVSTIQVSEYDEDFVEAKYNKIIDALNAEFGEDFDMEYYRDDYEQVSEW